MTETPRVPIARELEPLVDAVRAAGLPLLLVGPHGIGKSEFLVAWAVSRGLETCVLDLSLLEPTDLQGLPYRERGLTRYAPPASLPQGDKPCILILEELNRCDRSVRQPCLQLLTTRRLNDYALPDDCFLAACVNPDQGGYDVDAFDPALASRFVELKVRADAPAWLMWARSARLWPAVVDFVARFPQALDKAPPRSWTYAARLVEAAAKTGLPIASIEPALVGLLGPVTGKALALELVRRSTTAPPRGLLNHGDLWADVFRAWIRDGHLDAVSQSLAELARHMDAHPTEARPSAGLDLALAAAPPDLVIPIRERLHRGEASSSVAV